MLRDSGLTERVIGLAIEIHRALGPGSFESVYETCLSFELRQAEIPFERQVGVPIIYRDVRLNAGYRADRVVEQRLILEIKAVEAIAPIHEAQILAYLHLSGCPVGLLLNFNELRLKDGLRRFVV